MKTNRKYFLFGCGECHAIFKRRFDYISKMTGLCNKCANKRAGKKRATHGHNNKNSRLHVTWGNMKRRCLNPTEKEKRNYSGITLCKEWYQYKNFMDWALANGYEEGKTIDRIDGNGNYEPMNCRFVDYSFQSANRRKTRKNKTGYIGVNPNGFGKWTAQIQWRKKQIYLGTFSSKIEAAKARDKYIIDNELPHTLQTVM